MVKSTISRRQFLKSRNSTKRPELDRLNPNWPSKRVAKLYRTFLESKPPIYHPPHVYESAPSLPVTSSTQTLRDADWNIEASAHLLNQTVFGPTYPEILASTNDSIENSVAALFTPLDSPEPPGDWVNEPAPQWDALTDEEVMALFEQYFEWMWEMANWWLIRMTRNELNIRETMTLFWHNYFATAQSKVEYPQAMYQQNTVFREYGLGNFKELLRRVTFGPAMIIWLDIHRSNKDAPNENFARELLELFTMGVDNYSQDDIIEASRAFTGYVTNGVETNYIFETQSGFGWWWWEGHDFQEKTFMGQTGEWNGDDIINIIMDQHETAVHICSRIYKWFVYDTISESVVNEMAELLRTNDYNITIALQFLFTTEHFYDENFRGSNIQNPLGLIQGLVRKLGMEEHTYPETYFLHSQEFLGMTPLEPPDVSGWPGYRSWINSITLPARKLQAQSLVTGNSPWGSFDFTVDVRALVQSMYDENEEGYVSVQIVRKLGITFFGIPLSEHLEGVMLDILLDGAEPYDWSINAPPNDAQWNRLRDLILYIMKLPEFQLS